MNEHDADLPDVNDKTLTLVRELGFETTMCTAHGSGGKVYFLGTRLLDGQEKGAHATEDAVHEFIAYWESMIQVASDYLANGRNNKMHEWTPAATESRRDLVTKREAELHYAVRRNANILDHKLTEAEAHQAALNRIEKLTAIETAAFVLMGAERGSPQETVARQVLQDKMAGL